jgi:hypothetical protein
MFESAGYYRVSLPAGQSLKLWEKIHPWCRENLGIEHYAWGGMTVFWFETSQAALLFSLRWL